jgi:hypothetical protein
MPPSMKPPLLVAIHLTSPDTPPQMAALLAAWRSPGWGVYQQVMRRLRHGEHGDFAQGFFAGIWTGERRD